MGKIGLVPFFDTRSMFLPGQSTVAPGRERTSAPWLLACPIGLVWIARWQLVHPQRSGGTRVCIM
jgi:hypothetical protein